MEDISFNYIKDGIVHEYTILDKFTKNGKNYIIYNEDNNDELYASLYQIIDDKIKIIEIVDNKDYDIVDEYLENLWEKSNYL